jgi:hypothetical protein
VPADVKAAVLAYTINDIQVTHVGHTTSGIIGIKCMLEVLAREGRADVAVDMLLEDTRAARPNLGAASHLLHPPPRGVSL